MAGHESLKKQREVFTNNRTFLVDYLDADDVIDELIQEKLIGKNAAQRVQLQTTSREEKNRIIVNCEMTFCIALVQLPDAEL